MSDTCAPQCPQYRFLVSDPFRDWVRCPWDMVHRNSAWTTVCYAGTIGVPAAHCRPSGALQGRKDLLSNDDVDGTQSETRRYRHGEPNDGRNDIHVLCPIGTNPETTMTDDWEEIGFVISSGYRIAVMKRLAQGPATPSQIAEDSDRSISHISRALHSLRDRDLVDLLVPEERKKGRIYDLTDRGRAVWTRIETEQLVE